MTKIYRQTAELHTCKKTLRALSVCGDERVVVVEWMPLRVWGVDLGQENLGMVPVVWATVDECPVGLQQSAATGAVQLVTIPVVVTAHRQSVHEAYEVEGPELGEGEYRILAEWEVTAR